MKTPPLIKLGTLAASALLSACGGGDPPYVYVPPPPLVQLWTAQPHPYAAGSVEQVTFDEANRLRIRGGFGAFTYDANVTQTARNHLNYEVLNHTGPMHPETPGLPGFTGVGPDQRYAYLVPPVLNVNTGRLTLGEAGSSGGPLAPTTPMENWSLATGHLQDILDYQKRWVGIASTVVNDWIISTAADGTVTTSAPFPSLWSNFDLGYDQLNRVTLPAGHGWSIVGVYPFPGMTNVGIGSGNPGETFKLLTAPAGNQYWNGYGLNIMVQFPDTGTTKAAGANTCFTVNPTVSHFTLRKNGSAVDVPTRQVVAGEYDGTEPTERGWALMFATSLLEPNTQYNVDFAGSFCGTVSTKTWSFTTGTNANSQVGP